MAAGAARCSEEGPPAHLQARGGRCGGGGSRARRMWIEGVSAGEIGGQEHSTSRDRPALALPSGGVGGDNGRAFSLLQHPTEIQHKVADALGLPMNAVRCEVRRMGGWVVGVFFFFFGGKDEPGTGSPVRRRWRPGDGAALLDALRPRRRLHDHRQAPISASTTARASTAKDGSG